MSATLRAIPTLLRVGFAGAVAYRAEMVIWMLSTTMPLVMLAIWSAMAETAPVGDFTERAFVSYFLVAVLVRQFTGVWVVWVMNYEVRLGTLSMRLLKPMHPFLGYAGDILGAVPVRSLLVVPAVGGVMWWLDGPDMTTDPAQWALFLAALVGAWLLNFFVQCAVGCLSFWTDQSVSVFDLWFGLWAVLSGYLIPNSLLPEWAQAINAWLPFRYMLGFPVELGLGQHDVVSGLSGLAVLYAWAAAAGLAAGWLWRRGLRRYGAFGA